jgi:hypothetical protein
LLYIALWQAFILLLEGGREVGSAYRIVGIMVKDKAQLHRIPLDNLIAHSYKGQIVVLFRTSEIFVHSKI